MPVSNFVQILKLVRPYWGRAVFATCCLVMVGMLFMLITSLVQPIFDEAWTNENFNAKADESTQSRTEEERPDIKFNALMLFTDVLNVDELLPAGYQKPIYLIPVALIILFFFKGLSSYFGNYFMAAVGQSVVKDVRNRLYDSMIDKPISFFRSRGTGGLISRITSDVERIQYAVSTNLSDMVREFFTILAFAGYIIYMSPMFALIAFVVAPVVVFPVVELGKKLRKTSKLSQERMEGLTGRLHETFSGIHIVKAFCSEKQEKARFSKENNELLKVNLKATKYYSLTAPIMEMIGAFSIAYMIYYGASQIMEGHMTVGIFIAVLAALYGMYNPIKRLSRINNNLQQAFAAVDRINDMLAIEEEVTEAPGAVRLDRFSDKIEYRGVSFNYGDREVLTNISFTVRKGQTFAFVGLSGAGKTTLVNLLPRFDDVTEGSILIDGTDIREATLKSLRKQIGNVTQETILFNDTVRNNIAYGMDRNVSDDEVVAAARAAHAHEFIKRMPQGYQTIIGEKGVKLSGGERQRLAIARALIHNPPILILDEATSALDSESEQIVQSALENLMQSRTTFVIAHRLSTVRNADAIIVLADGKMIEQGSHSDLIERNGVYAKLHAMQFSQQTILEQENQDD